MAECEEKDKSEHIRSDGHGPLSNTHPKGPIYAVVHKLGNDARYWTMYTCEERTHKLRSWLLECRYNVGWHSLYF